MSKLIRDMSLQLKVARLDDYEREFRFHPLRRWRFDYAWPASLVALEIEGGQFVKGRHQRPTGFEKDCEKYNAASILGWTVIRATTTMVRDGRALQAIEEALLRK